MTTPVVAALVDRRAELAAKLDKLQGQVQQHHADLASLDAVIRQFDPNYNVGAIRPKYCRAAAAEFGLISRTVLEVLRRTGESLSAAGISDRIIAERGLNAGDQALVRSMGKRVTMPLRYSGRTGWCGRRKGRGN